MNQIEIEWVTGEPPDPAVVGAPQAVDVRMMSHSGSLQVISGRIGQGLTWMDRQNPEPKRSKPIRVRLGTEPQNRPPGEVEALAFRLCPDHLAVLDDELKCPEGHTCKRWMVKTRRIEFDGERFWD